MLLLRKTSAYWFRKGFLREAEAKKLGFIEIKKHICKDAEAKNLSSSLLFSFKWCLTKIYLHFKLSFLIFLKTYLILLICMLIIVHNFSTFAQGHYNSYFLNKLTLNIPFIWEALKIWNLPDTNFMQTLLEKTLFKSPF